MGEVVKGLRGPLCVTSIGPGMFFDPLDPRRGPTLARHPAFSQVHFPIRLLNLTVQLADLLGQVFDLALQLGNFHGCHPLDLAHAVPVRLFPASNSTAA